jgi:surface antigen
MQPWSSRSTQADPTGGPRWSEPRQSRHCGIHARDLRHGRRQPQGGHRGARRRPTVGGLIAAAAGGCGAGIAADVIRGALLGGLVGNYLDDRDKKMGAASANRALETAPSGQSVAWNNPDSGHSGTVTPVRTYQSGGTYCREYQQIVTIDGNPQQSYGTACRPPDGSWKIAN